MERFYHFGDVAPDDVNAIQIPMLVMNGVDGCLVIEFLVLIRLI